MGMTYIASQNTKRVNVFFFCILDKVIDDVLDVINSIISVVNTAYVPVSYTHLDICIWRRYGSALGSFRACVLECRIIQSTPPFNVRESYARF